MDELPYLRCDPHGAYGVATATLARHLAANERTQESALGATETLESYRYVGLPFGTVPQEAWAPPKHAPTFFDKAFFMWMALRREAYILLRIRDGGAVSEWVPIRPADFATPESTLQLFLRLGTWLEEDGLELDAEWHDAWCLLLDACNIVIADGNHKSKWPCCKFDDVRYVEIPDVAQIPYGCERNRIGTSDSCDYHLQFVGRRAPREDDLTSDARDLKDYCRADALQHAVLQRAQRRKARAKLAGRKSSAAATAAVLTAAAYTDAGCSSSASAGEPSAAGPAVAAAPAAAAAAAAPAAAAAAAAPAAAESAARAAVLAKRKRGVGLAQTLGKDFDEELEEEDSEQPSGDRKYQKIDRALTKLEKARDRRAELVAKLEKKRTLEQQVLDARKRQHTVELTKPDMSDRARFDKEFPQLTSDREEYLEEGVKAWHGLGDNAFLVESIEGQETRGLVSYHAVKFVGWKQASWEPSHSALQSAHVKKYEDAVAAGVKGPVPILPIDQAMLPNPNLPQHVVTMPMTQFAGSLGSSLCGVLKAEQTGEPSGGYLNTTAGVICISSACRKILRMMPMRNSETTTQTLWMLMTLKLRAPRWAARLRGLASDMACKVLLHIRAKLRDLPADSPGRPLYEWLNELAVFVDNFHFGNHSEDDEFCQQNTNPDLYPELSMDTDTEACEEIFRWWSQFKVMLNHMGNAKARYFIEEMRISHNERTLRHDIMSVSFMPSARLAEVCAAYGLPSVDLYGDIYAERAAREDLTRFLLKVPFTPPAERRVWSQELLDAHRARVGGPWREVHKRRGKDASRKRLKPSTEGSSSAQA